MSSRSTPDATRLHQASDTTVAQALNRTALYDTHLSHGAKMMSFAGWEMPLHFQGILAEVRAVRSASGIFDVSHVGRIWVRGPQAVALLDWVTTANMPALSLGRARFTLLCTQDGGILDDGIVYRLGEEEYLLVCNAANRQAVWRWLVRWRDDRFPSAVLEDRTFQVGMVAFQGPQAPEIVERLAPGVAESLRPFRFTTTRVADFPSMVTRGGYTGEDGFEILLVAEESPALWRRLLEAGAVPCGLGARDTLRLEAGLLLHGADMSKETNPFEAGLERFVFLDKESVGSVALRQVLQQGVRRKLTGFCMAGRGVPRHGYAIMRDGVAVGEVTSGGYSPTLDRFIGLGYVSTELSVPGSRFAVDIRSKLVEAEAVALPFYTRRRS